MNSVELPSVSATPPSGTASTSTPVAVAASVSMPGLRLVKAKDFAAQLSAQVIRKRAEANADQLIKDTLVRAAGIETAARLKGEQIGLQQYAAALLALEEARKCFAHNAEKQLVVSVFAVVRQLLPTLPDHLLTEEIAVQLIRRDTMSRTIQLFVPPPQLEYAASRLDAWRHEAGGARVTFSIEVKGDGRLAPDVCVLKSEFGSVTANLAEQLAALEKSAQAALSSSPTPLPLSASASSAVPDPEPEVKKRPSSRVKVATSKDAAAGVKSHA